MNLYWITVPADKPIVTSHNGLLVVYCEAESATAEAGAQSPSAAIEPAILMVSPTTVSTSSSKVTSTDVAVVHEAVDVVVVVVVVPELDP
jgi:hypothetical protein